MPSSPPPATEPKVYYARPKMRTAVMRPTEYASLSDDKLRKRLEKRQAKLLATKGVLLEYDDWWLELQRERYARSLPMPEHPSAADDFERECDALDAEYAAICTAKLRDDDPAPSLPSLDDVADLYERDGWFRAALDLLGYDADERALPHKTGRDWWLPEYACKPPHAHHPMSLKWAHQLDDVASGDEIRRYDFEDYLPYLPYLRRLGLKIRLHRGCHDPKVDEDTHGCKMFYMFKKGHYHPFHRGDKETLYEGWLQGYGDDAGPWKSTLTFYPTDARSVRFRGLLKCLPRLLRMLHGVPGKYQGARARVNDPVHLRERADAIERRDLADAMDTNTNENPAHAAADVRAAEAEAAEAWGRKRKLIDALHCDDASRRNGAKWICLRIKGSEPTKHPEAMRIEVVAGDHFIFHHNRVCYYNDWDIVPLHADAFEIVDWDTFRHGHPRHHEDKFASRFRDLDIPTDDDSDDDE